MTVTALAEIPGVLLVMLFANRFGRLLPIKTVLLVGASAFIGLARATNPATVICACCMGAMCLEAGWSLFHVYIPEAYPTELRATALGVLSALSALLSNWVPLYSAFILETESTLHA